ncbi:MAG: pyridoxal phosphate-dependent aminotransferase [Clostridia bacterium]|nr:pyridoxal phosphate-dependent aminotransferase [Clostridia bacterium]
MLNEKMLKLGENRSVIREIFEYGNKRRAEIGAENVLDFSLGNPSIPAPKAVNDAMIKLLTDLDPVKLHGYTSAQGAPDVRKTIADSINKRFSVDADPNLIYMTCGAAASLTICLNALCNEGDEVIALAPFFPEYRVFAEKAGAKLVVAKCRESDFQIDFNALEQCITENTKAIIINSPNNPTGVVFSEETIKELSLLLNRKQEEYGKNVFIICDEPYRELAYGVEVPYIPKFYDNTIVCYSYSKSLSLPGERIGYIFVAPNVVNNTKIYAAVCGAGRALGFVCAPSLLQFTVRDCVDLTSDVSVYKKNRDLLYNALTEYGYTAAKPDGAFYLFIKSPEADANAFCERAKKYELLLVPSDSFGFTGYVRISYCVSTEQIEKSLPAFKALIEEYK